MQYKAISLFVLILKTTGLVLAAATLTLYYDSVTAIRPLLLMKKHTLHWETY